MLSIKNIPRYLCYNYLKYTSCFVFLCGMVICLIPHKNLLKKCQVAAKYQFHSFNDMSQRLPLLIKNYNCQRERVLITSASPSGDKIEVELQ